MRSYILLLLFSGILGYCCYVTEIDAIRISCGLILYFIFVITTGETMRLLQKQRKEKRDIDKEIATMRQPNKKEQAALILLGRNFLVRLLAGKRRPGGVFHLKYWQDGKMLSLLIVIFITIAYLVIVYGLKPF